MSWLAAAVVLLTLGCRAGEPESEARAVRAHVEVVARFPHDPGAFTQGLLFYQGRIYESTGLRGKSSLREVELETGRVLRRSDLPGDLFGEGLARIGPRLIQLTYRAGKARILELGSFALLEEKRYAGEGWGLCFDGSRLVMSDGSATLRFRNAQTFEVEAEVRVRLDGEEVGNLNELECDADRIWANVWRTDTILEIDPASGRVRRHIDASGLLDASEQSGSEVLNGIARDPERDRFFITGKLWPTLFEVRFVED